MRKLDPSPSPHPPTSPSLELKGLKTYFFTDQGTAPSVDGVSLTLYPGETLCIVGESGCGKSVTALSILQLIPTPPGRIVGGQILFEGQDLVRLTKRKMTRIRGKKISMVFQEPMTSLNPVYTVGDQISEALILHLGLDKRAARERTIELLAKVGIPKPEERVDAYPHQLSGGMRQRVMIAMALSCNPTILIADEPTTALDVTIQAQILALLQELQRETKMSLLLITHNLGVVAEVADQVAVMYAGKIVEHARVSQLFESPLHPYTRGLFGSLPSANAPGTALEIIPGMVPAPQDFPAGCRFHPRCKLADDTCREKEPPLEERAEGHQVACWKK